MANLIHLSEIKIEILDRTSTNYDDVYKRPKGPLPVASTVTLWGQRQMARQQDRDPREQGDAPKTDGYVYFENPLPTGVTLTKGDRIVEVDGRVFLADVVEVRDETVYGDGPEWTRADFLRTWDDAGSGR